jgi:MerR family redox-sensitive transcriptional activator SoxR
MDVSYDAAPSSRLEVKDLVAETLLTIGELARRSGRRASAIRYYEQVGLLPEPTRVSGQRRYREHTVRTLAVIATAQRAGLTLDETKALLEAAPGDEAAIEELRIVATRKLPQLIEMIERAILVRRWLEAATRCQCPSLDECDLFTAPRLPPARLSKNPA